MRRIYGLMVVVSASCSGEPAIVHVGDYVVLAYEEEPDSICAGSGAHFDRYIERVFMLLEETVPPGFQILVTDSPCRSSHGACYLPEDDIIHAQEFDNLSSRTLGFLRHELTHAIVDRVWGRSIPFLEEGLAEALARSTDQALDVATGDASVQTGLVQIAQEIDYALAARFVRFLIDTRGISAFKRLFRASTRRSLEEVRGHFEEIYGESLDAIEAEYISDAPRCTFQLEMCGVNADPVPLSGWQPRIAAFCEDPDFYGTEESWMSVTHTILIRQAGRYVLGGPPMVVSRCGGCGEQVVYSFHWPTESIEVELDAGVYSIELQMSGETGEVLSPYVVPVILPVRVP